MVDRGATTQSRLLEIVLRMSAFFLNWLSFALTVPYAGFCEQTKTLFVPRFAILLRRDDTIVSALTFFPSNCQAEESNSCRRSCIDRLARIQDMDDRGA